MRAPTLALLLSLLSLLCLASAFEATGTGILVFWRAGDSCRLPPGAGARRYNSTPPACCSAPPRPARGWLGAARRFGRVKIVWARDGSARFVRLR